VKETFASDVLADLEMVANAHETIKYQTMKNIKLRLGMFFA
jgi:ATP phosphoribosyltransferase regulatory subunit HisZ